MSRHQPEPSVTQIALELGFASSQHLSTAFRKRFGIPPRAARGS
jgi:AraC-like DNA-binding protein